MRDSQTRDLLHQALGGALNRRQLLKRLGAMGLASGAATLALQSTGAAPMQQDAAEESAVPGPPWEGGRRGGTGRVAWSEDNITLDPPLAYDWGGYYGIANFHRGLLYFGLDTEPQLDLAESMDISDDATHYQFRLKRGVTFHNGRELTARDFKFTWERASSRETASWVQDFLGAVSGHRDFVDGNAGEISGIQIVDDYMIELVLDRPDVTIPSVLGIPPFYVLPSEELQAEGEAFSFTLGTGPWRLEEFDHSQRRYRASRFDDYVYADHLPYFDELEWEWGITPHLQSQRVQRGELDATGSPVPPATVLQLQRGNASEDELQVWDTLTLVWHEFNTTRPPFNDKRVRQAFNYAFNKERLQRLLISPTGHLYSPLLLGYDPNLEIYPYDPERARALLKEAGYDNDLVVELPILNEAASDLNQMLQQDLAEVGVTVQLPQNPAGVYDLGHDLQGMYDFWARGWGMGLPDPAEIVNSLAGTDAPSNFSGYGNEQIDALGLAGQATVNVEQRAEIYAEIERMLLEDAPFLFEGVVQWGTLKRPELQNFVWEPVLFEHWDRYWHRS